MTSFVLCVLCVLCAAGGHAGHDRVAAHHADVAAVLQAKDPVPGDARLLQVRAGAPAIPQRVCVSVHLA